MKRKKECRKKALIKTQHTLTSLLWTGLTAFALLLINDGIVAQVISGKSNAKTITIKNTTPSHVKLLPDLYVISEVFEDENGNQMIDANEKCYINFKIENLGNGVAQNVVVKTSLKNVQIKGLTYDTELNVGNIEANSYKKISIPINGYVYLEKGIAEFKFEIIEGRGFDAFPLEMKVTTNSFSTPRVIVADAAFTTEVGGLLQLNYPITLKVIVQNVGLGDASGVYTEFVFPNQNCVVLGEDSRFNIGLLKSGETRELDFVFTATRRYTESEIPVMIDINESFNKYSRDTTLSVNIQQELTARNQVVISGMETSRESNIVRASLTSTVDKNIPQNRKKIDFRYALVIGNEDYSRYQKGLGSESDVDFARSDAEIFHKYVVNTLGVEADNAFLLIDATSGEMQQKIELISKLAAKSGPQAEIIFYYAGHGLPDEVSREPYLIPVDVAGSNLSAAIKLADVYKKLGESQADRITVFLDACFSGGGRDASLIAARAVKVKPKTESMIGNMVVFSATTGTQSALPYSVEQHGMFSFYLLKKIQESGGNISYGDLAAFIQSTVSIESLKVNQKEQDPQVKVSYPAQDSWRSWMLID